MSQPNVDLVRGIYEGPRIAQEVRAIAHLWTVRDGQAVRMDAYATQREALEAVAEEEGLL